MLLIRICRLLYVWIWRYFCINEDFETSVNIVAEEANQKHVRHISSGRSGRPFSCLAPCQIGRVTRACTRLARSQHGRVSSATSDIMSRWASFRTLAVGIMPVRASYPARIWDHASSDELSCADLALRQLKRVIPRWFGIVPVWTSCPALIWHDARPDELSRGDLVSCQLGRVLTHSIWQRAKWSWRLQQATTATKRGASRDEFPRCHLASSQFGRVALAEDLASCQVRRVARRLHGIMPIFFARKFTSFFVVFKGTSRCF